MPAVAKKETRTRRSSFKAPEKLSIFAHRLVDTPRRQDTWQLKSVQYRNVQDRNVLVVFTSSQLEILNIAWFPSFPCARSYIHCSNILDTWTGFTKSDPQVQHITSFSDLLFLELQYQLILPSSFPPLVLARRLPQNHHLHLGHRLFARSPSLEFFCSNCEQTSRSSVYYLLET